MEKWLNRYGKYLNYSAIEIELDIPGGTLMEAHVDEDGIPEEWRSKIEKFLGRAHEELVKQNQEETAGSENA